LDFDNARRERAESWTFLELDVGSQVCAFHLLLLSPSKPLFLKGSEIFAVPTNILPQCTPFPEELREQAILS